MQVRGALACIDHNSNRSRKQVNLPCCSVEDPVGSTTFSRIRIRKKLPCCRCWHICIYTVCTGPGPLYTEQHFDASYCTRYPLYSTLMLLIVPGTVLYIQYFDHSYCTRYPIYSILMLVIVCTVLLICINIFFTAVHSGGHSPGLHYLQERREDLGSQRHLGTQG
jgi:hypothetical protein